MVHFLSSTGDQSLICVSQIQKPLKPIRFLIHQIVKSALNWPFEIFLSLLCMTSHTFHCMNVNAFDHGVLAQALLRVSCHMAGTEI